MGTELHDDGPLPKPPPVAKSNTTWLPVAISYQSPAVKLRKEIFLKRILELADTANNIGEIVEALNREGLRTPRNHAATRYNVEPWLRFLRRGVRGK